MCSNPNAPAPITAALGDPSPVRRFWGTWDQPPKSKFIPLPLKWLRCFELRSQEEKGSHGKFLLSHVLPFFQRQEVIVALLWELFSSKADSDAPTTSPWAPLPRILISSWHLGMQAAPPAVPPLVELLWITGISFSCSHFGSERCRHLL